MNTPQFLLLHGWRRHGIRRLGASSQFPGQMAQQYLLFFSGQRIGSPFSAALAYTFSLSSPGLLSFSYEPCDTRSRNRPWPRHRTRIGTFA
jgi:hypothetical protein